MSGDTASPRATVLIPVYNAEAYLVEALESVSAQTCRDIEILVIDDGSTDRSPQLLADYALTDPRLRVVRQPNGGISAALNLGIAEARGALIVRMDADDVMLPQRIEAQAAFLDAHPALGFCASAMNMIDSQGRAFKVYHPRPRSEIELDQMLADQLPVVFTHPTVTYRTAAVRAAGGYDRSYEPCEDMELFGRLLLAGQRGWVMPDVLMNYRVHGTSISGSKVSQQVRTQEFVRAAFYARRAGRRLDRETHDAGLRAASWVSRLQAEARLRSDVLRRTALYRLAAGQHGRARLCLMMAAAHRPWPALRAVLRRLFGLPPSGGLESARRA